MRLSYILMFLWTPDHANFIVSMLQEILEKDQRVTMLQLVDKMKTRNKDMGVFCFQFNI